MKCKKITLLTTGLLLSLTLLTFTGCSSKQTEASQVETSSSSSGITEINWWAFPVFAQENSSDKPGTYERSLIHAFEAKNPDIKVNLTMLDYTNGPEKLELGLTGGDACDVLFDAPGRIIAYGKQGHLAPLNDMFTNAFITDMDNEELLKACQIGETPYMYPLSSAPFYMVFNRSMLEEAGVLDLVQENWTTDDFTTVLQALSDAGYVPGSIFCNGTGGDQGTRAFLANLFDGSVMNDSLTEYTLGDEQGIQAMDYVQKCVSRGLILDGTLLNGSAANENFVYGRASFSILWGPNQQTSFASLMETYGVESVEVPLPSPDGVPSLEYLVNGFCIMNNEDDARIAASKRFLSFICDDAAWGPQNVIQTGCIPVRHSFGNLYENDARMQDISKWTKYYIPYYNTVDGFATMRTAWSTTLRDVLGGYAAPEKALADFTLTANQSLNSNS